MVLNLLNYGLDIVSFVTVNTAVNDKKGTKVTSFHNRRNSCLKMALHFETLHVEINLCFKQHKPRNYIT